MEAYDDHALSESTGKRWFRNNDFDGPNEERGRSKKNFRDAELQGIF